MKVKEESANTDLKINIQNIKIMASGPITSWQIDGVKMKAVHQVVYCHPAYLTSMQGASCEMLGWMNHKLESRLLGEISTTLDMQMIPF